MAEFNKKLYLDLAGLTKFWEKAQAYINAADSALETAYKAADKSLEDAYKAADKSLEDAYKAADTVVRGEFAAADSALETKLQGNIDKKVETSTYEAGISALESAYIAADAVVKGDLEGQLSAKATELTNAIATAKSGAEATAKGYTDEKVSEINSAAETLAGRVSANEQAIATLNGGEAVAGSVAKAVADGINDFATKVSDDQTINTFKEMIDYAAAHKNEYATLSGDVQKNTTAIATLNGEGAGSVKAAVAAEETRAMGIEAGLRSDLGESTAAAGNSSAFARIKNLEVVVADLTGSGDGEVESIEKQIADAVAAEAALRVAADEALQKEIDDAEDRLDVIEGEGEGSIKHAVAAEAAIARAAEKANSDAIDAIEADYLKAADKAELANSIKAISDDYLKGADKTELSNAIAGEKSAREQAVAGVQESVNTLSGTVSAMDAAYKAADTALGNRLSALEGENGLVAQAIASANAYTDTECGKVYASIDAIAESSILALFSTEA